MSDVVKFLSQLCGKLYQIILSSQIFKTGTSSIWCFLYQIILSSQIWCFLYQIILSSQIWCFLYQIILSSRIFKTGTSSIWCFLYQIILFSQIWCFLYQIILSSQIFKTGTSSIWCFNWPQRTKLDNATGCPRKCEEVWRKTGRLWSQVNRQIVSHWLEKPWLRFWHLIC